MKYLSKFLFIIFIFSLLVSCESKSTKISRYLLEIKEDISLRYYEDAYNKTNEIIKLKTDVPQAYYYRGNLLYSKGKFKEAMDDYNKAIELDSNYVDAIYNRGLLRKTIFKDNEGSCQDWLKAERLGKANMSDKTRWCK